MDTTGEPRRLELEVELRSRPIQGRIYERDGEPRLDRQFSGWLGLMSAIEAARDGEPRTRREQRGEWR